MNIQSYAQQSLNPQYVASQNPAMPISNLAQQFSQNGNAADDFSYALHVDGFDGARSCKIPPNCKSTIAYDNKLPMVYFIFVVDGERKVFGYDTTPHPEPKPVTTEELTNTLQAINQRLKNLEDNYDGLNSRLGQESNRKQTADSSGKQQSNGSNQGNAGRH